MKRLGSALSAVALLLVASSGTRDAGKVFAQGRAMHPTIEIVTPHSDEQIANYPIYVEAKVSDFTLAQPVQYWDRVDGPLRFMGHIHYTLDDSPILATSGTHIMLAAPAGKSLPVGKHVLRAELVTINHEPLNPPSFAEIPIVCTGTEKADQNSAPADADAPVPIDGQGQNQLKKVEEQLQHVQDILTKLKQQIKQ